MKENGIIWMLKQKLCMLSNFELRQVSSQRQENGMMFLLFFLLRLIEG